MSARLATERARVTVTGPVHWRAVSPEQTRRALVTGAAGFIGSHVADGCLELGMEVVATDDLSGGFRENVPAGAEWIEGDLRDAAFVASLWEGGRFDYVYHLGAYAAEGLSHFIRAFNYRTNLEASVNLINQAILTDAERFVFTSSIAVYGAGQVPMVESMVRSPKIRTASPSTPWSSISRRRTRCSGSTTPCSVPTTSTGSART